MTILLHNLQALSEVGYVLKTYSTSVFLTGLPLLVVSCLIFAVLSRVALDISSMIAITLGGAISLSVLALSPVFFFQLSLSKAAIWVVLAGLMALALAMRPWNRTRHEMSALPGFMLLCFVIGFTRLPFLRDLYFPLNTDSAYHYQLISRMVEPHAGLLSFRSIQALATSYYHYGFHTLVAFAYDFTGLPINQLILLLGQLLQVLIPISLYPIGRWTTGSPWGGYAAMTGAAFGWAMPLRASSLGKYPALLGLEIFLLFLSLLIWMRTNTDVISPTLKKYLIVILSVIAVSSILAHSRDVFLILSVLFAIRMQKMAQRVDAGRHGVFLWASSFLLGLLLLWTSSSYDFQRIVGVYFAGGVFSLLVVLVFARYIQGASLAYAVEQVWFLISCCFLLVIPVPFQSFFDAHFNLFTVRPLNFGQLIDRPFAETFLFVPLTVLIVIAISGRLSVCLAQMKPLLLQSTQVCVVGGLVLFGLAAYPLTPTCCEVLSPGDLQIIEWMKNELPQDSVVLISVAYSTNHRYYKSTDAGVWIEPLTRLKTINWSYDDTFDDPSSQALCSRHISYVYAGADPYSFDKLQLRSSKDYIEEYRVGDISVFRLDCRTDRLPGVDRWATRNNTSPGGYGRYLVRRPSLHPLATLPPPMGSLRTGPGSSGMPLRQDF